MTAESGPNYPGGSSPGGETMSEMALVAPRVSKVRELQRKLWAAAKRSPDRRFHALHDRIWRGDVLQEAWKRVLANKGAAGVDRLTLAAVEEHGVERMLSDLQRDLREGSYRPSPSRRVGIPKPDGSLRPLGIPTVRDRVAQQAARLVLEPIFEAGFAPASHGFRPRRSATAASEELRKGFIEGYVWALDADIRDFLGPSSHCHRVHGRGVEQAVVGRKPDSEAFSAAAAAVDGVELAALDTLQHGLAGDAEDPHGVDDRHVAGGCVLDEEGAELVVDADPPGGAGGVLFATDEAGLEPAVQGGGGDAELVGGLADGQQLAVGRLGGRLVGGDLAIAAQAADDDHGEPLAGGAAAALAVEDAGDRGVVVVGGEALQQRDRVLVGADRGLRLGERDDQFGDRAAFPADRDRRAALFTHDVEDHFLDQAAQQLLAVAVGRGGRRPDAAEVGSQRQQLLALGRGERPRALVLAQREFGLGVSELCERLFPVAFEAAGDEPVLGLDLAVAALCALGLVFGSIDLQPPLFERRVVVVLERLGCVQRGLDAGGSERGQQRAGDRLVDLRAADAQAPAAAAFDQDAAGAVIGGALVPAAALVVDLELAAAAAADRDPLQQRGALADGAGGLVRARARVGGDPPAVLVEGGPVDVAAVVLPDQDVPFCLGQATHPLARLAVLVDVALAAGLAERVGARVDGVLEHAVDLDRK